VQLCRSIAQSGVPIRTGVLYGHFTQRAERKQHDKGLADRCHASGAPCSCAGSLTWLPLGLRRDSPSKPPCLAAFSQAWPDEIEISMERDIRAETFPGVGVDRAVLVELTPAGVVADLPSQPMVMGETGRVDATIVVRQSNSAGLALVIESKLYGRAGHEQLLKYKQALESRHIKTLLVDVAWEEIYTLADSLPEAAEHDAILSDFKSFLARHPRLAGFTGFRQGDFDGPAYVLDARLQKLCETLAGQSTESGTPERKS
jgi:hypothetical protein